VNVVGEIQRENVSSISLPLRPKGRNGLVLAPWSGAPNQSMVGGPPSHSAIKRGWGPRLAVRGSPLRHTPHPTKPNPTRRSTRAARSSATAAAEAFLLDPTYTMSPPDARPHRLRHYRPRAGTASLRQAAAAPATTTCEMASDSAPPSNPDGLRPCFPSVLLLVVLGVVDLDQERFIFIS
jgi:hypothetical protein